MHYCNCEVNTCQLSRIIPVDSQVLTVYFGNEPVNITLDSGATSSFITHDFCKKLKLKILPNGQMAKLGDGCTIMASVGEIDVTFTRNKWSVRFQAIVVEKLNSDIYGGMNFLKENDIQTRPLTGEIKILNKFTIYQTNTLMLPPQLKSITNSPSNCSTVTLPKKVLFPPIIPFFNEPSEAAESKSKNDSILNVVLPIEFKDDDFVLVEPRTENKLEHWPPVQIVSVEDGLIAIENTTDEPISIPKDAHVINIIKVQTKLASEIEEENSQLSMRSSSALKNKDLSEMNKVAINNASNIDISKAPSKLQNKLKQAHLQYADVFAPDLTVGYNGNSGEHIVRLQFADDNRPQMTKCHVPKWSGKNDKIKQKKMDVLERQGVLVDPYKEGIPIKLISPSFLRVKARAKDKDLEDCDMSELRWIISPGQLNPHLRQLQTNNVTKEDMFVFKSEKPHCIEFDLYDGYFQNHISREDWGYLAVETPYKGMRVLTRSGQGLLNQEIEMGQLLTKVLGEEIEKKNVIVQADDGQVGGSTTEETVDNWIRVLKLFSQNNIKINHQKVKILPDKSLIHGWEFKDGYVQPSPHRQLAILDMKQPKTIGEMRTYMGVYKTFFPAMEGLTNIMTPFDTLCGGKDSKELITWNDELSNSFKESQKVAQTNIHKLALPHPDEQLFIVPDSCSRPPATGFILFVSRINSEQKPIAEPVMFVTWKLSDLHWQWSPCEIEGLGASIAVDKCAFYILRSSKPTLVFPDNKQVIQAFNKLKKGRYSTSQRLATFTNNIQRYPVEMQHGSGKLLQNLGADYIGRTTKDCTTSDCSMCKFASERSETLLSTISNILKRSNQVYDLDLSIMTSLWCNALPSLKDLPIGNIAAWSQLQYGDAAVSQAIKYKMSGQNPPKSDKSKEIKEIRHYVANCKFNSTSKLLVKEIDIPYDPKKHEKIVVPSWFVTSLLTQIHQDQSCPETSQLKKIFDRYFYGFQISSMFSSISDECHLCKARKKIPKEIKHFTSITNPPSPCVNFVSDVMRRAKQFIFVTRDSFSDFVATAFIKSESASDLKEGLIQTTSTVRRNSSISVRVDNAPGFLSLKKQNDKDLAKLNIVLDLSDPENKNGVAIVDKAIQELEKEIIKLSPEGKPISSSELAQATLALNSRIRNRDLSSHEILFSREQNTGENINLDDKGLAERKMEQKLKNHKYSEKSKFHDCKNPDSADAVKGDRVYLKKDGGKHNIRDLYVVVKADTDNVTIVKLLHAHDIDTKTKLGSKEINAKQVDIYLADSNRRNREEFVEEELVGKEKNVEKQNNEKINKDTIRTVASKSCWSPFLHDQLSSESEDLGDSSATSDEDETDSSSDDDIACDLSDNSTRTTESEPDNIFDMQFNQLQGLVNSVNEIQRNGTNSTEDSLPPNGQLEDTVVTTDDLNEAPGEINAENVEDELFDQLNNDLYDPHGQNPSAMPNPGDKIAFLDTNIEPPIIVWAKVIPMFKTMQKRWPGWYNIIREGTTQESSVDLSVVRWKVLSNASSDNVGIEEAVAGPVEVDHHNAALRVVDNPLQIPFPEVRNFDDILPLSSTPSSENPAVDLQRARLSAVRPRGLLPMEIEESPLHRPSGSRIQQALTRRADQVRKILSRSSSDSSTS